MSKENETYEHEVKRIARTYGISETAAEEVIAQKRYGSLDNQQLLSVIERVEKLNADIADIEADKKEIFLQAKSAGFDPKYIKQMITLRKLDPDELDEVDELTDMYRKALGI